jgi:hypothetical protein
VDEATTSKTLATMDASNAFNSPERADTQRQVARIGQLHGIWSFLYGGTDPEMLVQGAPIGSELMRSERGTQQGRPSSVDAFALTLQPILRDIAAAFPTIKVRAFVDDVTFVAANQHDVMAAIRMYRIRVEEIGISLNLRKCECMPITRGMSSVDMIDRMQRIVRNELQQQEQQQQQDASDAATAIPAVSAMLMRHFGSADVDGLFGFVNAFARPKVIKLLGARVGLTHDEESAAIYKAEIGRRDTMIRRLTMMQSPQGFAILRRCFVLALTYTARVNPPESTAATLAKFDCSTVGLVEHWACTPFDERARMVAMLPTAQGGLGLPRMSVIAAAAYACSLAIAGPGRRPVQTKQRELVAALTERMADEACERMPGLEQYLQHRRNRGVDALFANPTIRVNANAFGAALRRAAGAPLMSMRGRTTTCPGCNRDFGDHEVLEHFAGCACVRVQNAGRRHNAIVAQLRLFFKMAGWSVDEEEPRDLWTYACRANAEVKIPHESFAHHKLSCTSCRGTTPLCGGPDIRRSCPTTGRRIVDDFTAITALARSNIGKTLQALFDAAEKEKAAKYGKVAAETGHELVTLAATSDGHLSPTLAATIARAAKDACVDPAIWQNRLSALIAAISGEMIYNAEARVARPPDRNFATVTAVRAAMASAEPAIAAAQKHLRECVDRPEVAAENATLRALANIVVNAEMRKAEEERERANREVQRQVNAAFAEEPRQQPPVTAPLQSQQPQQQQQQAPASQPPPQPRTAQPAASGPQPQTRTRSRTPTPQQQQARQPSPPPPPRTTPSTTAGTALDENAAAPPRPEAAHMPPRTRAPTPPPPPTATSDGPHIGETAAANPTPKPPIGDAADIAPPPPRPPAPPPEPTKPREPQRPANRGAPEMPAPRSTHGGGAAAAATASAPATAASTRLRERIANAAKTWREATAAMKSGGRAEWPREREADVLNLAFSEGWAANPGTRCPITSARHRRDGFHTWAGVEIRFNDPAWQAATRSFVDAGVATRTNNTEINLNPTGTLEEPMRAAVNEARDALYAFVAAKRATSEYFAANAEAYRAAGARNGGGAVPRFDFAAATKTAAAEQLYSFRFPEERLVEVVETATATAARTM